MEAQEAPLEVEASLVEAQGALLEVVASLVLEVVVVVQQLVQESSKLPWKQARGLLGKCCPSVVAELDLSWAHCLRQLCSQVVPATQKVLASRAQF